MAATITMPQQIGTNARAFLPEGSYTFTESHGNSLQPWVDPRGQFRLNLVQCMHPNLPGFRVIFVRSTDGKWAGVECWFGDATVSNSEHCNAGYTLTVQGDFAGQATTPHHWWGARWRMTGNKPNGLRPGRNDWPYELTPYAMLRSEGKIPEFDPLQLSATAHVPITTTYASMGSSSLTTEMGSTGGRNDIGLFNGWAAAYPQCLAPTANASWRAAAPQAYAAMCNIAEAGSSIPWYLYDPAHGQMWERIVNHADWNPHTPTPYVSRSTANPYVTPAPPGPGAAPSQAALTLIATGPAGAQLPSPNKWWTDPTYGTGWYIGESGDPTTIPTSGTATLRARAPSGYRLPTAAPTAAQVGGAATITYAWNTDTGTCQLGTPWSITISHCPEVAYLSYLFHRDPWDLHTIQAALIYVAAIYPTFAGYGLTLSGTTVNPPRPTTDDSTGPTEGTTRAMSWHWRNLIQAMLATPAQAPPWLIPASTLAKYLAIAKSFILQFNVNGAPIVAAERNGMFNAVLKTLWHSCEVRTNQINDWQDAFFCQASALGAMGMPNDPDMATILAWTVHCKADRYSGTRGWPKGAFTLIATYVQDPSGNWYQNLADAWADRRNKIYFWTVVNKGKEPNTLPPDPTDRSVLTGDHIGFPSYDFAALSLAVQAGVDRLENGVSVRAARNWVASMVKPVIGNSAASLLNIGYAQV